LIFNNNLKFSFIDARIISLTRKTILIKMKIKNRYWNYNNSRDLHACRIWKERAELPLWQPSEIRLCEQSM